MTIATVFVIYAFVGKYLPGFLHHRGYSLQRVVCHLFYNTEGIMGTPIGACSTFIFLFILFGALLEKTGIGQFFIDVCNAIAGGASGGPAKVAVLSSALLGTVSGSSVSNTVGSGSFTIPMMKRLGYKGEFAGAVEASASTGGQQSGTAVTETAANKLTPTTVRAAASIATMAPIIALYPFLQRYFVTGLTIGGVKE